MYESSRAPGRIERSVGGRCSSAADLPESASGSEFDGWIAVRQDDDAAGCVWLGVRFGAAWEDGPVQLYRDQAIVVRQHKLGEADRIVTLLTRQHGLVRAVAKGVRRTRSKFGARLEPFAYVDVQLYPGRNLDTVTQVHTVEAFASDIVADYGRYTAACAVLETAERLAGEERAPAPRLHTLTAGALRAIAAAQRPQELILDAFLLRAMGFAGWAPALDECARCATPGPHRAFHVAAGGAVCVHCRPPGSATPSMGVLELMSALCRGEWSGIDDVPENIRRQSSGLTAAHLQWHLERQLRTLPLLERTRPHGAPAEPSAPRAG